MRGWVATAWALVLVLGSVVGWAEGGIGAVALAEPRPRAGSAQAGADDVAVGIIVDTTNPRSMRLAREAGFTHAKMIVHWPRLEPRRGRYAWLETTENDLDNVMKAARAEGMKLVLRVDGVPDWAGGSPGGADLDALAAFYQAMASHGSGTLAGFEILNEPNLPFEWGGPPSPAGYVAFLEAAYRGAKQGDPNVLVIGGGVSPRTGGNGGTMEDVDFLRGMYAAGAKGHMDALSVHNYGGNYEPERDPGDCSICFRRAEVYRQVMVEAGDATTKVWATEFGWLMDPGRDMGQYDWMRVSEEQQADYAVRAFRYARANWPWMTGLLLSNLDASTSPYHTGPQNGMPWFAILNKDHSPRKAWHALRRMHEQDAAASARRGSASSTPRPATATSEPVVIATPTATATETTVASVPDAAGTAAASQAAGTRTPSPTPNATVEPTAAVAAPIATAAPTSSPEPIVAAAATPTVPASAVPTSATTRARVARTDGTGANLRSRPSATSPPLALLAEGASVEVVGPDVQAEGRTWRNVRSAAGQAGWVAAQYVEP